MAKFALTEIFEMKTFPCSCTPLPDVIPTINADNFLKISLLPRIAMITMQCTLHMFNRGINICRVEPAPLQYHRHD